jgi:hypothetical protein
MALGWLAACGRPGPAVLAPPPPTDDAVQLAALLPDEVERCVVARPGLVAERRRGLVLRHSLAEPTAWAIDLRPIAYASAVAERPDGRRARRSYYRFADDATERAREVLMVRWLDEPCEGDGCAQPVARWLDDRTLEVAHHEWPRRILPIPSGACVRLAGAHPDATEVALDRAFAVGLVRLTEPRASRWTMRASRRGIARVRELEMRDPMEARILLARIEDGAVAEHDLVPTGAQSQRVEREGEHVRVIESRTWEELELAVEDEQLLSRAGALEEHRRQPVPIARVRLSDLGAVRHQVELRRALVARTTGAERERAAAELADLLARAWAAHPSELELARSLVRLALDVLDDPARASSVIRDVVARGLAHPAESWQLLEREALARTSPPELAQRLVSEGVASADAVRAAEDLRSLTAQGVSYEWAEGAWRASRALADPEPLRRADARLPFEGVLGALVGWARLDERSRSLAVHFVVRGSGAMEARRLGEHLLAFREARGATFVGALASLDVLELRRIGAAIAGVIGTGPLEITLDLRDAAGERVARQRVAGTLSNGVLTVDRVSADLADVSWPVLGRYLAQPLAELPTALFPSPTLTVRAESDEHAAALRRRVASEHPDACETAGPVLRCRSPGRPELLGQLLVRIAAARLASP